MSYELRDEVLEYQGHRRTLQTLGWWCSRCGEAILAGEALLAHESAFLELRTKVEAQGRGSGD
jgi:YgiT-type zinc finger domain-containing protein